ncbi:hypothetical protein RDABS01_004699, partial [Bienertia sinuspersici]
EVIQFWDHGTHQRPYHSTGQKAMLDLELPIENSIQYKLLLKRGTGEVLWKPDPDRSFQAWETDNVITVIEEWDSVEAQKIMSSHVGDMGSDKNNSAENKDGANLKENPSLSAVNKSRISDRKP